MTPGEIAKLIGRLHDKAFQFSGDPILEEAAVVLEQLSSPVPPAEVAEMMTRLNACVTGQIWAQDCRDAARLLQRLAGEVERLKRDVDEQADTQDKALDILMKREDGLQHRAHANGLAEGAVERDRLRAELSECKAQNRAMAETVSGLVGLRAELETANEQIGEAPVERRCICTHAPLHTPKPAAEKKR
jgi:DNA repair exonuclease SbcCD ATPase subunit